MNPSAHIHMRKIKLLLTLDVIALILLAVFFAYRHWRPSDSLATRAEMLSLMPEDAGAVAPVCIPISITCSADGSRVTLAGSASPRRAYNHGR